MEEKFFTTEQVANILQVHPFTILKFIKQGKLKGIKIGRRYRLKESDINNFIEQQTIKSEEENLKRKEKKVATSETFESDKKTNKEFYKI